MAPSTFVRLVAVVFVLTALVATASPQCEPIPVEVECSDDSMCDQGDVCLIDYCDPDTRRCVQEPVPDGTTCDDHDSCTFADA